MTVLLTGYEPFGDHDENPSERVARALDGETIDGRRVEGVVLPVAFARTAAAMCEHVDRVEPDAVVSTGLAGGETAIRVERVGVNVNDAGPVPDNDGAEPHADPVDREGADAYLSTVPVVGVVETLLDAGIPARVSNSAGTHLCNNVLYSTLAYLDETGREVPAGFVHLPYTPAQAARKAADGTAVNGGGVPASLPLETQVEALRRTIARVL